MLSKLSSSSQATWKAVVQRPNGCTFQTAQGAQLSLPARPHVSCLGRGPGQREAEPGGFPIRCNTWGSSVSQGAVEDTSIKGPKGLSTSADLGLSTWSTLNWISRGPFQPECQLQWLQQHPAPLEKQGTCSDYLLLDSASFRETEGIAFTFYF